MDGRAIAAGALADAGLRQLASETGGPRPSGVDRGSVERAIEVERTSVAEADWRLRATRD